MGCDYYINTDLCIYYYNNDIVYINLSHEKGYFYDFNLNEDDENYDKKYEYFINEQLKPAMEPIIIYENNKFINSNLEIKYKKLIENNIQNFNTNVWNNIKKIVKKEYRYERD